MQSPGREIGEDSGGLIAKSTSQKGLALGEKKENSDGGRSHRPDKAGFWELSGVCALEFLRGKTIRMWNRFL